MLDHNVNIVNLETNDVLIIQKDGYKIDYDNSVRSDRSDSSSNGSNASYDYVVH